MLGNPKAWLGTAYHHVLEHMWESSPLDDQARSEELWANAIRVLQAKAASHELNRRFANPEQWPGYHLVRAFTMMRAKQALHDQPRQRAAVVTERVYREQEFTAMNGKLVGKPDVILGNEIRDYKSGRIYDTTAEGEQIVKQAYVRQLRLYGRLVQESLGVCPAKGILLPMEGPAVEVALDAQTCASEATEAVRLLDSYNSQVQTARTVMQVANPSSQACRWCQYKALCPAFWARVDATWRESLGTGCVRGVLTSPPQLVHNDRAFCLTLTSTGGTAAGEMTIAPLERTVHANVEPWQAGDAVRVVNLYCRNDGRLAPTNTTVCLREQDLVTLRPSG